MYRVGVPIGSAVKNPPLVQEMWQEPRVWSLSRKDALEEEMATHSSILAWTEESGRLQPVGPWKNQTRLSDLRITTTSVQSTHKGQGTMKCHAQPHNNFSRWITFFPLYRWARWGLENWSLFSKFPQQINGYGEILINLESAGLQSCCSVQLPSLLNIPLSGCNHDPDTGSELRIHVQWGSCNISGRKRLPEVGEIGKGRGQSCALGGLQEPPSPSPLIPARALVGISSFRVSSNLKQKN